MSGFGDAIKAMLEAAAEKQTVKDFGPNYLARKRAAELANQKSEQEIAASAEAAPLNRAYRAAQTTQLEANTEYTRNRLRTSMEIAQAKLAADHEMDPMKKSMMLAQIEQKEAQQREADAHAGLMKNQTENPGAYHPIQPPNYIPGTVGGQPSFVNPKSLEPAPPGSPTPPMPATMQGQQGMAKAAQFALTRMHELASAPITAGPVAGRVSQAGQAIFGPSGPEGEFDFLGKQLVDTVYLKSGKQINEHEMRLLTQMIPNRARGNLGEQVRLFTRYANMLLSKYGAPDTDLLPEAPPVGPAGPGAPGAPTPPPGFRLRQ